MNKLFKFLHARHGNAMIETAVFLPVMVLLLLGVVDFGVLLNQYLRVADSARSAAEIAAVRSFAGSANSSTVQLIATSSTSGIPGYSVATSYYCLCGPGTPQITCSNHAACGSYGIPNQYVQVTATAQLPLLFAIKGIAPSYSVKSVAIARTPWTGTN